MKREELKIYFKKIKDATKGDNTSNSEIIDYENENSISIDELEDEYYKYLDLQQEIEEYAEDNDLDDVNDKKEIERHFDYIDNDLFEFNQAVLVDFVEYMSIKINKINENQRKANMMFNRTGNGSETTRITIPVIWARKLGFSSGNRDAILRLDENKIIIEKGNNLMKFIEKENYDIELLKKLYNYLNFDLDNLESDIQHDYLTQNESNGKVYYWYIDENNNVLIDMQGNIISDEKEIQKIMNYE